MGDDPDYGSTPTRPKQKAQPEEPRSESEDPTMVKCPTCAAVAKGIGKLGCPTCLGAGFITYERYLTMTKRCPTCLGTGRVTNDQSDALEADAKRHDNER